MITLEPMEQEEFEQFLESEIHGYAEDHVRNGNWPAEGAVERSRKEFEALLPEGIHSTDQYLWSIVDPENNKIGMLWVQVKDQKAFIYDFVIDEAFRGKGYGKQALTVMDEKLKSMGVESVGLHVFGDNIAHRNCIRKWGIKSLAFT